MKKRPQIKRVVLIGGAGGVGVMIRSLIPLRDKLHITVIQSPADNGGSTGEIRKKLNTLPHGDVRRALLRLSRHNDPVTEAVFAHRFTEGPLAGHVIGNLVLAGLEQIHGSFEKGVAAAKKMLRVTDEVIMASLTPAELCAELSDGTQVIGETHIDIPKHDAKLNIKRVWFSKRVRLNPRAAIALKRADLIVIGPGDLYTSVIPNLLVTGMSEAITKAQAPKVFVTNSLNKQGETHTFTASDFIKALTNYLPLTALTFVIANRFKSMPAGLETEVVHIDSKKIPPHITVFSGDFAKSEKPAHYEPARFTSIFEKLLGI